MTERKNGQMLTTIPAQPGWWLAQFMEPSIVDGEELPAAFYYLPIIVGSGHGAHMAPGRRWCRTRGRRRGLRHTHDANHIVTCAAAPAVAPLPAPASAPILVA
jgi:hypothetical protein